MNKKELESRELSKRPLKSDEIIKLDMPEIAKLSDKALRVLASTLVSSSNKRVRRLLNAASQGISEAALRGAGVLTQKFGVKDPDEVDVKFFSIRDKTRNRVMHEVRRMIEFQRMKTSTVKGAMEVYDRNERLIFGESTRDAETRRIAKEKEIKQWERIAAQKRNQTPERQTELRKWRDAIEVAYSAPDTSDAIADKAILETMDKNDVMSAIYKFYRRYEENHAVIIKDYGSDKILRMLGAYTNAAQTRFATKDDLTTWLNETMPDIIQSEWELLPGQEAAQEEFFAAFERHMKTGEPVFSEEDGWR